MTLAGSAYRGTCRLTNATQLSLTERALLQENDQSLTEIKNEAKVRQSTRSQIALAPSGVAMNIFRR
jgi:hypothetical protein